MHIEQFVIMTGHSIQKQSNKPALKETRIDISEGISVKPTAPYIHSHKLAITDHMDRYKSNY
jgi:hypothetical protein